MVDRTRDAEGKVRARLLDLVPGRSKKAYADWLGGRSPQFRAGVQVAALDPFAGYKTAIADELADA
uniref:transposase n=1 Tax=Sediminivirga luteola TaxID=1774748 RepID=UPI003B00A1BE